MIKPASAPLVPAAFLFLLAGCGGGGQSLISIGAAGVSAASGAAIVTLDAGSTLPITASVVNDSGHAGATFALTGPGALGASTLTSLSSSDTLTLPYTAPATASAGTSVVITATSVHTPSQKASLNITLNPALTLSPATLPSAVVNTAYRATVTAAGGTGTVTYSVSGTLPAGLVLSAATGVLSGTPTATGTYNFSINVTDAATLPGVATQAYTLVVNGLPPVVTSAVLPTAPSALPYAQQLTYTGGTGAATFAISSGSLPSGLTLSTSGLLSGTPATVASSQTSTFSVTATTGTQTSAPTAFTLTVAALPSITTASLPAGNVGIPYSVQLASSGGVGAPSYSITAGSLPPSSGLTLNSSGLLSGTPAAAATYTFSVSATTGSQTSTPQPYTLTINSLIITSAPNAPGEAALPFSFQLTAAGGTAPYTWSLAPNSNPLPAGLSLNSTTGFLTGTPTASGNSSVTVQAKDATGVLATQPLTITVNPARGNGNNSLLKGSYAFLLSGFDSNGQPQAAVGRFTADGAGNLLSGTLDSNGTGIPAAQTSVALLPSTYSVGADNRGKLTLVTTAGTTTLTFALDTLSGGVAGAGTLAQFDLAGQAVTGVFALQTSLPTTLNSGFAFGLQGFAANANATVQTHRAAIGELQFNGTPAVSSAELLLSSASSTAPIVPAGGTLTLAPTGRGTLALTLPNGAGSLNFVIYVISPTRFFLLSADPTGTRDLLSGQALAQTIANGSFSTGSLNATAVFRAESFLAATRAPQVELGLLTPNGSGLATESFDLNSGGTLTSGSLAGPYSVASNGRTSFALAPTGLGGCTDCTSGATFAYLTGPNQGFLMDFSPAALSGFFEPQTAVAPATGSYSLGTPEPLSAAATLATGSATAAGTAVSGTLDTQKSQTLTPNAALAFTLSPAANGRFATSASLGYIVSATRIFTVDTTTRPALQVLQHQ